MSPGFRYHVVSIAAVFFALTVGLVVGSLLVSPRVADQQKSMLHNIQNTVNKELTDGKKRDANYKAALAQIAPELLRDRLKGESIALIQVGEYPETADRVKEALQQAGANVSSVTNIEKLLDKTDDELKKALLDSGFTDTTDRESVMKLLVSALLKGEADGESLSRLETAHLITRQVNGDYVNSVSRIILIAGSRAEGSTRVKNVDLPLAQALLTLNKRVVMVEPVDAATSDVPQYRQLNIEATTIDNADTDIGGIALVLALTGDRDDYGVKPATASRLMPPISPRVATGARVP